MSYQSPGVYVEEVPSSIKPIAGVSTSTAGFLGIVPDPICLPASDSANPGTNKLVDFTVPTAVNTPTLVTSWAQFTKAFGDFTGDPTKPATSNTAAARNDDHTRLVHAVYGFFNNGGSRCYVVRAADVTGVVDALKSLATIDEIAIVAAPGRDDTVVRGAVTDHCGNTGGRFAILDGPARADDLTTLTKLPTPAGTKPADSGTKPADSGTKPADSGTKPAPTLAAASGGVMPLKNDLAAWYFPWIKVYDPATDAPLAVPPSGHIAGIYARVDSQRGVHKAPANEPIMGALSVNQPVSKAQQEPLNQKGVNCIRVLNDSILVWGARTCGGDDNADLKYVNVRRTLLFLRKSIEQGTQWVVFEPNTPALWQKITRNVTAFLTNVWRSGALFGTTPQEAFYVKCDKDTNDGVTELGQVVTEIGVAIVRPAEFVIFHISQYSASSK